MSLNTNNKNKEVWAIIPARSGSKSVKDKNIMLLSAHPMIAYTINIALQCSNISRVIVTTDSKYYADIALKYGAEVPFLRPENISEDSSKDIEFFQHAVDWFKKEEGYAPEYFVHLRPSTPIRSPILIDQAIEEFLCSDYSALRSVHKMSDTSYKTFEIEDGKLKTLFNGSFDIEFTTMPRQTFPVTFNPNGYIDIVRTSMIENGLMHGNNVKAFITDTTYEIDEMDDFNFLEYMVSKNPNLLSLFSIKN
ncbi:acylneuraminate cytidylyltransferase family protein [Candidatus Thioglobus sp.]|nr:acylneuraminate cytidylyltransferase family protein [Candidatus Thioglobus sp.]